MTDATAALPSAPPRSKLPPLVLSDGAVESLKWLALVLMTGDHINKYLLGAQVPALFAAGRLAFPLFAFVLAYNLARPQTLAGGAYGRVAARLVAGAAIASAPFIGLGGLGWGWWPLNILAAMLTAVGVMYLADRGGPGRAGLAALLFLVGGGFVEFWWPGVAMTLAAWHYVRRPSVGALLAWIIAIASMGGMAWLLFRVPMSLSLWSLAAIPLIFAAAQLQIRVPRLRWMFYAYYPAHLAALWLFRSIWA